MNDRRRRAAWCAALAIALGAGDADAAPSEYRLYAGTRERAELFTANTLTAGRLALRGVDRITEEMPASRADDGLAIAFRSGELVLVDLPILSYTIVVSHELFGHAARYAELDAEPKAHFDLPLPYSLKADHYVTYRPTRPLYQGEKAVSALAGLETQEASQRMLAWTAFRADALRRGEALIYASTSITHAAQTLAGRDLEAAADLARPLYRVDPAAYRAAARGALVLDAIDPMFLYALYASAWRWLVRGEAAARAPSIAGGGARLFATSRTLPVPWGVEHQLHLLAAWPWAAFDLGVRTGAGARGSFGVELATAGWRILETMRAGGELAFWTQPLVASEATLGTPTIDRLSAAGTDPVRDRTTVGGAARLLVELDRPWWFLGTRLGWKSAGLWGERDLAAGFEVAMTGGVKLE